MKYMVAELMFTVKKAWYENGMICMLMSDNKEIRFPVEANKKLKLDNCSFNRPFDDQNQIRISIETEAKIYIQEQIIKGRLALVWSYMLDYENSANPVDFINVLEGE